MISELKKCNNRQWPIIIDKDYLRIPTKNKVPLRKDWSIPVNQYYKEPKTIFQLLAEHGEYGIRTGLFVYQGYHLAALIFRRLGNNTDWQSYFINLFPEVSYTETEKGLYYLLLIKELPPTCAIKNSKEEVLGDFYAGGRLVIGAGSKIANFRYRWIKRKVDFLTFANYQEFQNCLAKKKIELVIKGKVELNQEQNELVITKKLDARWKRRNLTKWKLEQAKILTQCSACNRKIKKINLWRHIEKIHPQPVRRIANNKQKLTQKICRQKQDQQGVNWRKAKFRTCKRCFVTYQTIITRKKHREFYCLKIIRADTSQKQGTRNI